MCVYRGSGPASFCREKAEASIIRNQKSLYNFAETAMSSQAIATPKTLPARYYTDPEVFREELDRFYCQTWICAGRADQIPNPGDYFLREVAGESIIITRDQAARFAPSTTSAGTAAPACAAVLAREREARK